MKEDRFQSLLHQAQIIACVGGADAEYIVGYQRGLRRAFYGERFGTEEEHQLWLSLADRADAISQSRGKGYRDGLQGLPLV